MKVFGFGLGFGVESFWIGLKVLGFGGGFFLSGALSFCLGFGGEG